MDNKKEKDLVIPKGTPIAYNVCELLVAENGSLQLLTEREIAGGFTADEVDSGSGCFGKLNASNLLCKLVLMRY